MTRRRRTVDPATDPASPDRWLHFSAGKRPALVIAPHRCPRNIPARQHWTENPDDPDGLGRCLCADDAEAADLEVRGHGSGHVPCPRCGGGHKPEGCPNDDRHQDQDAGTLFDD